MSKNTKNNFLTISDLLLICLRHWTWFVISVVTCLTVAVIYLSRAHKVYTSHAAIIVREERPGRNTKNTSEEFADLGLINQQSNITNEVRHITSLDVLYEVAHQLWPEADGNTLLTLAQGIQTSLYAERESEKTSIINLAFSASSPERATEVLSLVIKVYNEKWQEDKHLLIQSTSQFIDSRLELLQQDLGRVDDSISTYKSRYGITDLSSVSDIYLRQQSQSDAQLLTLSNQKAMAQYIQDLLNDESHDRQLLIVNSGINNPVIEAQITTYNTLLMQLNSHLTYTSDQNPMIVSLEKEISSLRENIKKAIANHIKTIDIELQAIEGYNSEATSKISSNPIQAQYLASIEREQKVKESLYLYLLQKKEENEISNTYSTSPTRIIDMPHSSDSPTSPKTRKILMASLLLGLIIPIAVIFLIITLDDSVKTRSDVESNCDVPVIGELPRLKNKARSLVVSEGGKDRCNEAFRLLRTKLDPLENDNKVFLVTSLNKGAGKTFVCSNLAKACALGGKKVLLIDADLRSAGASALWKTRGDGLSSLLNGKAADYQSLICRKNDIPGLDIMPAGKIPVNPSELLMNGRLESLVKETRDLYDVIFIDSPTSGIMADADIIKAFTDYTLLVIRSGKLDRRKLADIDGERMRIVLNAVEGY